MVWFADLARDIKDMWKGNSKYDDDFEFEDSGNHSLPFAPHLCLVTNYSSNDMGRRQSD
jgi:hypothetical protein